MDGILRQMDSKSAELSLKQTYLNPGQSKHSGERPTTYHHVHHNWGGVDPTLAGQLHIQQVTCHLVLDIFLASCVQPFFS